MREIIDNSKNKIYVEKINSIVGLLERNYQKLQETKMVNADADEIKNDVLKVFQDEYYDDMNSAIFPFIVNSKGKVVAHPTLEPGNSIHNVSYFKELVSAKNGNLNYVGDKVKRWICFKYLKGWDWFVIYSIPLNLKYADANRFKWTLAMIMTLIAVVVAFSSIMISRFIKPIVKLTASAREFADGNLTQVIEIKSKDELSDLAVAFNSLVENFKNIIKKIYEVANQLDSVGTRVLDTSKQQSDGTSLQSSAVSETSSASIQLSKSTEQVGDNINKVSDIADNTMRGMGEAQDVIKRIEDLVKSLFEKSEKIGTIINVIDDVGGSNQLLAVNAAVEAARAGAQGAGFTVVSEEIGKLSESTAKSTKEITALVEIVQHEIEATTICMDQGTGNINDEMALIQDMAIRAKEITMSVKQQIRGSKQIAEAMKSIDDTMKHIVIGTQQSQELAKKLAVLSSQLSSETKKFKVD